jgi:hypothetical protein
MKNARILTILILALCTIFSWAKVSNAAQMGTAFTYQGHLYDANHVANDAYDFQFKLYDANSGSSQIGSDVNKPDVDVIDGYFTVELDFSSSVFDGDARWLEIGVRPGELEDSNSYTPLLPRQQVTPTSYALYAETAGGLANSNFWNLTGNSGTSSSTNFLGTIDNVALEIRVNSKRGFRIEPDDTSPNIIGGFSGNNVTSGATGATISGGGADLTLDQPNIATDDYCTVSGGRDNQAGNNSGTTSDAMFSTAGGGWRNKATGGNSTIGGGSMNTASGVYSAVGGGENNKATYQNATIGGGENNEAKSNYATVSGGRSNIADGIDCTIGGGSGNKAGLAQLATIGGGWDNEASGQYATISGGAKNFISAISPGSTIGGGQWNNVDGSGATLSGGYDNDANNLGATVGGGRENKALGQYSTIGGGFGNESTGLYSSTVAGGHTNIASGEYATVPGGTGNEADGNYSFAAGRRAKANNDGCFVWGDATDADLSCNVDNRWLVRSSGGVYFYTEAGLKFGVYVAPGGNSWNSTSDRATKEKFEPVNGLEVLERLVTMPIAEYKLKSQDDSIRHVGPVAQDFAVFGYGESDKAINMEDADGVAFAAIQGLYKIVQEKDVEIIDLKARLAKVEELVAKFAVQQEGGK